MKKSRLSLLPVCCLILLLIGCGSDPTPPAPLAASRATPFTNITLEPATATPLTSRSLPTPALTTLPPVTNPPLSPGFATLTKPTADRSAAHRLYDTAAIRKALSKLSGNSAALVILPDGQTVEANPDRQMASASTIKLWVAGAVLEQAKAGKLNLAEKYQVAPADIASGTGILGGKVGQSLSLLELVSTMLSYSDNSATNILLDKLGGFGKVNAYALSNGYASTRIQRRLGSLDSSNENLTAPHDAAIFMQRLLGHKIVDFNSSETILLALEKRLSYPQDQNFFGSNLAKNVVYRHLSGTGPGVRNEVGFIQTDPDLGGAASNLIIAIYTSEGGNEAAAESNIALTIEQIYRAGLN